MMVAIELVWDDGCPHVDEARSNIAAALVAVAAASGWTEWRRADVSAPSYVRRVGSPAVLVNGVDVEGHQNVGEACCRLYVDAQGRRTGAPSVEAIVRALRRAAEGAHDG